jgi:hypothetical protein
MHLHPSAVGTLSVKADSLALPMVQLGTVEKSEHLGVDGVPQLMTDRRAKALHREHVPGPA